MGSEAPAIHDVSASTEPHEVRITSHGKIKTWVEFALAFFETNETRPLIFHTHPGLRASSTGTESEGNVNVQEVHEQQKSEKKDGMSPSLVMIPRLLSVVEIVKREYLKKLDTGLAEQGALSGLHQYNEVGTIESSHVASASVDTESERIQSITLALSGKNHPKLEKRNAFMKVTLCRTQVPHIAAKRGVTYQKPNVRLLSKSAKARAKRKLKKVPEPNTQP